MIKKMKNLLSKKTSSGEAQDEEGSSHTATTTTSSSRGYPGASHRSSSSGYPGAQYRQQQHQHQHQHQQQPQPPAPPQQHYYQTAPPPPYAFAPQPPMAQPIMGFVVPSTTSSSSSSSNPFGGASQPPVPSSATTNANPFVDARYALPSNANPFVPVPQPPPSSNPFTSSSSPPPPPTSSASSGGSNANPFVDQPPPANGNPFAPSGPTPPPYSCQGATPYDPTRPPASIAPSYVPAPGVPTYPQPPSTGGYPGAPTSSANSNLYAPLTIPGGVVGPQYYPPSQVPGGYPMQQGGPYATHYQPLMGSNHHMDSTCTGRKKALFIGINYFGTRAELRGCINDVRNLRGFIQRYYGFDDSCIKVLTDDPSFTEGMPTRQNILRAMYWLVEGVRPGDSLFFHFSGHGGSVRDQSGDEYDGRDETILPIDFQRAGEILDDDIHTILVKPLPRGVRLTAIFDSCHSGSVMDLPFSYRVDGGLEIIQIDNRKQAMSSFLSAGTALLTGRKGLAMGMAMQGMSELMSGKGNDRARKKAERENQSEADVIQFSGCRDNQTSADASANGMASGAMSHGFVSVLETDPHMTYTTLLKRLRDHLKRSYSQIPQMSTSHVMDLTVPFNI